MNLTKLAEVLDQAAMRAEAITQLSLVTPFDLESAYTIQAISIRNRLNRGEQLLGLKMGFTSKAKMEQMGVHDVIWGMLTSDMEYQDGDTLDRSKFIHPRAEPEIAFLIRKDINETVTLDNVNDYIEGVAIAVEVIDSRYANFKFSLEDVVADNCSSAAFAIGEWHTDVDVRDLHMQLSVDGKVVQEGNSNAILDNPYESLLAAIRLAKEVNQPILEGAIILAGAATPAESLTGVNTVEASADKLGKVSFHIN